MKSQIHRLGRPGGYKDQRTENESRDQDDHESKNKDDMNEKP